MQSMKIQCLEKKRVGSTKKRVDPNVTQQYIPGDDSGYTVNGGEVSLSKTVDNKSIQKNNGRWRRVNPFVDRGNQTTTVVEPKSDVRSNTASEMIYILIVRKYEKKSDDQSYVYTRIYRVNMIKNTFLLPRQSGKIPIY